MRIFLTILTVILLAYSCGPNVCEEYGYECADEGCVCPEGSYEYQTICRSLEAGEYWGAINCHCVDTLFMKLIDTSDGVVHYSIFRPGGGTAFGILNYQESWLGDTISASQFSTGQCIVDGKTCTTGFYGRFLSPDTIRVTFRFRDEITFEWIDQCTALLHK